MRYSTPLIRMFFPSIVCRTLSNDVHLTFDDGPHPIATPTVLDILRTHGIKATFFVTGEKAKEYPDLIKRIQREQHAIGNHGYSHQNLFLKSSEFVRHEIETTASVVHSIVGTRMALFRPPFGSFDWTTLRIAKELDYRVVLWSFDSRDFEGSMKDGVRLGPNAFTPGSIILFHDNDATATSVSRYLPTLLENLQERGTTFSSISTV